MRHSIIDQLPSYGRFLGGKNTLGIGYPWLSVGAILCLEQCVYGGTMALEEPKRVLEFGSGGSTIFFAKRAEYVRSIETDKGWAPKTAEALATHGVADKVELTVCTNPESEAIVSALPDRSFDLLLVDHAADESVTHNGSRRRFNRKPLAMCGLPKLKSTGWLVVDNYAMHGMEDFDYAGWDTWHFDDLRYSGRGTLIGRLKAGGEWRRKR